MVEEPVVLKESSCPSLSATSDITYQIGSKDGTVHIRLVGNSGNGYFNGYWVSLPSILMLLNDQEEPFIWDVLQPLFRGKSVNSACFLMAALKHEGLVKHSEKEPRRYVAMDPKPFVAEVQALMAPKPKAKKGGKKPPPEPLDVVDPPADSSSDPVVPIEAES